MKKSILKIIIFKRIGISMFFFSLIPAFYFDNVKNIISLFFILVGSLLLILFRCPYCKHQLDPRLKASELSYCPNCGHSYNTK